jgi:hypothetical protein
MASPGQKLATYADLAGLPKDARAEVLGGERPSPPRRCRVMQQSSGLAVATAAMTTTRDLRRPLRLKNPGESKERLSRVCSTSGLAPVYAPLAALTCAAKPRNATR